MLIAYEETDYIEKLNWSHELTQNTKFTSYIIYNSTNEPPVYNINSGKVKTMHYPSNRKCEPHLLILQITKYFKTFMFVHDINHLRKPSELKVRGNGSEKLLYYNAKVAGVFINSKILVKAIKKNSSFINNLRTRLMAIIKT